MEGFSKEKILTCDKRRRLKSRVHLSSDLDHRLGLLGHFGVPLLDFGLDHFFQVLANDSIHEINGILARPLLQFPLYGKVLVDVWKPLQDTQKHLHRQGFVLGNLEVADVACVNELEKRW